MVTAKGRHTDSRDFTAWPPVATQFSTLDSRFNRQRLIRAEVLLTRPRADPGQHARRET